MISHDDIEDNFVSEVQTPIDSVAKAPSRRAWGKEQEIVIWRPRPPIWFGSSSRTLVPPRRRVPVAGFQA